MNTIDTSGILTQMRALAAQATAGPAAAPATGGGTIADFSAAMKEALSRVNDLQQGAAAAAADFERGAPGVDLTSVMLEVQKAGLAFKAVTEVRNRLVAAYQEVMSMPI